MPIWGAAPQAEAYYTTAPAPKDNFLTDGTRTTGLPEEIRNLDPYLIVYKKVNSRQIIGQM